MSRPRRRSTHYAEGSIQGVTGINKHVRIGVGSQSQGRSLPVVELARYLQIGTASRQLISKRKMNRMAWVFECRAASVVTCDLHRRLGGGKPRIPWLCCGRGPRPCGMQPSFRGPADSNIKAWCSLWILYLGEGKYAVWNLLPAMAPLPRLMIFLLMVCI